MTAVQREMKKTNKAIDFYDRKNDVCLMIGDTPCYRKHLKWAHLKGLERKRKYPRQGK